MVEHSSEETEDTDALQLIAEYWKKVGIKMLIKPQTLENFRLRTFSGEAIMTAYAGVVTAVPTVDTSPKEFAPTMQGGLQWSRWGMFVESKGKQGEKCDMPSACKLMDYLQGVGDLDRRRGAPQGLGQDPRRQRRRGVLDRHGERHPPARSSSARRSATCPRKAITPGIRADTSGSTSPTRSGSTSRADG